MNKVKTVNKLAMLIGFLGICAGIIALIKGLDTHNAMFNVFVGGTLFGASLINYKNWKGNNDHES